MKFFSVDSHLYRFLSRFLDVLKLNFMWLVFCVPIITIGASTVAAFTVALRMVDDEEGYVARGFIKAFKENFKQGTMLFVITVVAVYAVYLDFQLFEAVEGNPIIFLIIGIVSCFIVGLSLLYAYPLIARYDNSIIKTIQNSFEISKRYFPRTIFLIIIVLFELFIFQYNSTMLFFGILIGPAFVIFTIAAFSKRTFQQIEKDNNN
jgi:uncharacterized membrane protein YesL